MPAPPSFDFFATDWLGGTRLLSSDERGAYINLLCQQWKTGHLPETDHERRLVAAPDVDKARWNEIWKRLLRDHFEHLEYHDLIDSDPGGNQRHVFVNEKLHQLRQERVQIYAEKCRIAQKNGTKGGRPKRKNSTKTRAKRTETDMGSDMGSLRNPYPEDGRRKTEDSLIKELDRISDEDLRQAAFVWFSEYKSKPPKPAGLKAAVGRMENLAAEHGPQAVAEAIQRAMANGWAGWDHGVGGRASGPQAGLGGPDAQLENLRAIRARREAEKQARTEKLKGAKNGDA